MDFFISNALADAPAAPPPGGGMAQLVILVVFALIFYFLLWRPQSKRAKEHRQLVEGLQKGDEVITNGGILGKITEVTDGFITIKVAEGVNIKVQKHAVGAVVPKGTIKGNNN